MFDGKFHSQYKGIYFKWVPEPISGRWGMSGIWVLSTKEDTTGICQDFHGDKTRLDQCFDKFQKTLEAIKNIQYYRHTVLTMGPDLVQKCIICGEIISDYRNTMSPAGTPPARGFAAGIVYVSDGNPRVTTIGDPSDNYAVIDCKIKTLW